LLAITTRWERRHHGKGTEPAGFAAVPTHSEVVRLDERRVAVNSPYQDEERYWRRPEPLYTVLAPLIDLTARIVVDVRVVGSEHLPRHGPVLLVANHVSFLDPCVLFAVAHRHGRRLRFVALHDLFSAPLLGWLLRRGRMIPVSRGRGADEMIRAVCEALEAAQAVLVYPEGTIPSPGSGARARPGAGSLALQTTAPVVPVASWGLERGRPAARLRRRAGVAFGPRVDLSGWRGRTDRAARMQASEAMLAAVRSLLPRAREVAVEGLRSSGNHA
jgi:1-acyl-sn-glycerol-3-phosphate acyltransferase